MRTAIIHHWLTGMRGGERVLEQLIKCYPNSDIFTHVYKPDTVSDVIRSRPVTESFIARMPLGRRFFRHYVSLMPRALEEFDLSGYDLVISSEAGPVKGVMAPPDALHVCYSHSPMRYIYDQYGHYRSGLNPVLKEVFSHISHDLRQWDAISAMRVDAFVANSNFTAQRIRRAYGRSAKVVHPPVNLSLFHTPPQAARPGAPYLMVSELVPYKRVDLAIEAFRGLDRELVIAGDGAGRRAIQRNAPPNVTFLGRVSNDDLVALYSTARALIFPGEEDFGIVPVEAMACGCPVIAYGRGGLLDSVVDGRTGVFFGAQTTPDLVAAIERFERMKFHTGEIAAHAHNFSEARFRQKFTSVVDAEIAAKQQGPDKNRRVPVAT